MEIKLTKEQYYNLVKLITIAGWVLETVATEIDEDGIFEDEIEPMLDTEQYILSKHEDFKLKKVFKDSDNYYSVTYELEEEVLPLLELFAENSFWDELAHRLARRDVIEEYGESAVNSMDPLQLHEFEDEHIRKYQDEFSQNGIDRLKIKFQ